MIIIKKQGLRLGVMVPDPTPVELEVQLVSAGEKATLSGSIIEMRVRKMYFPDQ